MVIVDVGLKSEGRIPINEFSRPGIKPEIEMGQKLNVYIENVDSINGETKLSREKAVNKKPGISFRIVMKIIKLFQERLIIELRGE